METIELLKRVDLFSGLKEDHLKEISKHCVRRSYNKGEIITRQGDQEIGLFIIGSGKVLVFKELAHGDKLEIASHDPEDFIGEMAVLDNDTRSSSVMAVEDTECVIITTWDFKDRMKAHPEIAIELLPTVVKRIREINEKLIQLSRI